MKIIVITGSTRGIGFGLADSFLSLGCAVCINGRTQTGVDLALDELKVKHTGDRVLGIPCDISQYNQVKALWDRAKENFGKIDIWINNAGVSNTQMEIWKSSPDEVKTVVDTSLLGAVYGSMVAVGGFLKQGDGSLYNMQGLGSDGRIQSGLAFYGTTKSGLNYFTQALVKETENLPVLIGSLQPGMVITDMITDQYRDKPEEWERVKPIFNIIADRVENVTPVLAEQILSNRKTGRTITYLPRWKLAGRFVTAPFSKRDLFNDQASP